MDGWIGGDEGNIVVWVWAISFEIAWPENKGNGKSRKGV